MNRYIRLLLVILVCCPAVVSLAAGNGSARRLVALLQEFQQREEVTLDSFFADVRLLRTAIETQTEAVPKAVYQATLAHLLVLNMHRSQAYSRTTESHPDSIQEWSQTEYRNYAQRLYNQAMSDMDALHQTHSKEWLPLVKRGKSEGIFGRDMLHVVWHAYRYDMGNKASFAPIISFYRTKGLREASLRLTLDSLEDCISLTERKKALQSLMQEYKDEPACALTYLRMSETEEDVQKKRSWLEQGLGLYPKAKDKAQLTNAWLYLQEPVLRWKCSQVYYPEESISIPIETRNVKQLKAHLYRLPDTFDEEDDIRLRDKDMVARVRALGQFQQEVQHTFAPHAPFDLWNDTLKLPELCNGYYALIVDGKTDARLNRAPQTMVTCFRVSRLSFFTLPLSEKRHRCVVVDSKTGLPVEHATVRHFVRKDEDFILQATRQTDSRGMAEIMSRDNNIYSDYIQVATEGDTSLPKEKVRGTYNERSSNWYDGAHINLYTDRSIYRPGQTIYVGALSYQMKDWEAQITADTTLLLTLQDADRKVVMRKDVRLDAMGTMSDSLQLPSKCKPGTYWLLMNRTRQSVRVEEYQRPTFYVKFDPIKRVEEGQDSVWVSGQAMSYTGLPMAGCRVVGRYMRFFWNRGNVCEESQDTLFTDVEGRFRFHLPVMSASGLKLLWGSMVQLEVDVLSSMGETQSETVNIPLHPSFYQVPEPRDPRQFSPDSTSWMLVVCDTFCVGQPAELKFGTRLKAPLNVYYTFITRQGVAIDQMVTMRDSLLLSIPYLPEYDKGGQLMLTFVYGGTTYCWKKAIYLRKPDHTLRLRWDTFRDFLQPGQQEEWRLSIRRPDGAPAQANVLLSLYDASLDAIMKHRLQFSLKYIHTLPQIYASSYNIFNRFNQSEGLFFDLRLNKVRPYEVSLLNEQYFSTMQLHTRGVKMMASAATPRRMMKANATVYNAMETATAMAPSSDAIYDEVSEQEAEANEASVQIEKSVLRTDLRETAFFYPQLRTNADGQTSIAFTLPQSLTTWHLTGFAHTADLMSADIDENIVARKELMAQLYLPRFLRIGDEAVLTANVSRTTDAEQRGKAELQLLDAESQRVIKRYVVNFALAEQADTVYTFLLRVPDGLRSLQVRWVAKSVNASDGEQREIPILSNREKVTETRAFCIEGSKTFQLPLQHLFAHNSLVATHRSLQVEYTSRPMWLAVKALPSLFVPMSRDALSLASAFYATVVSRRLLELFPADAALLDSLAYTDQLSLDSRMSLISALSALQQSDGSIAWYPGLRGNEYITLEVAYMLARMNTMRGPSTDAALVIADKMQVRVLDYLTEKLHATIEKAKEKELDLLQDRMLQYMYVMDKSYDLLSVQARKDMAHLLATLRRCDMNQLSVEARSLAAIVLKDRGYDKDAKKAVEKFHRLLQQQDGVYLAHPSGSFTSIDRKVQMHVQVMEALRLVEPQSELLAGMKNWLLQQKRTQQWDQPVHTVNAVHALLDDDAKAVMQDRTTDVLKVHDVRRSVTLATPHTQLGYLRDSIPVTSPRTLTVEKHSSTMSWGAVYATYEMPIDSIRLSWQGLRVQRSLEPRQPQIGQRLHVRYTLTADRDYDFVQLVAPRSAAVEPTSALSGCHYQNGLSYYQTVFDDRTEYYFDSLPRGTYVIEEDWLVTRQGHYQVSPATITCLYAPEFRSTSDASRMKVGE